MGSVGPWQLFSPQKSPVTEMRCPARRACLSMRVPALTARCTHAGAREAFRDKYSSLPSHAITGIEGRLQIANRLGKDALLSAPTPNYYLPLLNVLETQRCRLRWRVFMADQSRCSACRYARFRLRGNW